MVRCDFWHVITGFATFLALVCLLLPAATGARGTKVLTQVILASSFGLLFGLAVGGQIPDGLLLAGPRHIWRLQRGDPFRQYLARSYREFRERGELPPGIRARIGKTPVDVYPWEISLIAANDLNWSPRFVLQSYQAFHPALDALGAAHYAGPGAPRFILYRFGAIDGQHPCLVDSRTWLEMYRWYDLVEEDPKTGVLLLERRKAPRFADPKLIETRAVAWNQRVELGRNSADLVILQAELSLTRLGQLQDFLYKISPPEVRIEYADGTTETYRFVWKNLAGGALVSALPRDRDDVTRMFGGSATDRVRAVTFVANPRWFQNTFQAKFSKLPITPEPPHSNSGG